MLITLICSCRAAHSRNPEKPKDKMKSEALMLPRINVNACVFVPGGVH